MNKLRAGSLLSIAVSFLLLSACGGGRNCGFTTINGVSVPCTGTTGGPPGTPGPGGAPMPATGPATKFLYVANTEANTSDFSLAASSGVPTFLGNTVVPANANAIAAARNKFIYVASANGTISGFSVNPTNGVLTEVATSPFPLVGSGVGSMVASPTSGGAFSGGSSGFLYAESNSQVFGFNVDPTTGDLVPIVGSPFNSPNAGHLAMHPSGKFLYVTDNSLLTSGINIFGIDQTTGALTQIGTTVSGTAGLLSIDPAGKLLLNVVSGGGGGGNLQVFSIATDGTLNAFPNTYNINFSPSPAVIDNSGQFLYVASGQAIEGFLVPARSDVTLTVIPGFPFIVPSAAATSATTIDSSGRFLYVGVLNFGATNTTGIDGFVIQTNGTLAAMPGGTFLTGTHIVQMALIH